MTGRPDRPGRLTKVWRPEDGVGVNETKGVGKIIPGRGNSRQKGPAPS